MAHGMMMERDGASGTSGNDPPSLALAIRNLCCVVLGQHFGAEQELVHWRRHQSVRGFGPLSS